MHKVIDVDLVGQARPFRLHEDAYDALGAYLDGARARLGDVPDADEVIDDLERSIGGRLATRLGTSDRVITAADVSAVLEEVGAVETEDGSTTAAGAGAARSAAAGPRPRKRRLYRISEGQWFAGVCNGLAVYSDIGVDWVRTIFIFGILVTVGLVLLVYLVMAFVLPVVPTRQDWYAAMDQLNAAEA